MMVEQQYLAQMKVEQKFNTASAIYQKMEELFNSSERLLVLLDETLAPNIFDDLKQNFRDENIIYVPLAKGNGIKNTSLFFIEIIKKEVFEKVGHELAEYLLNNFQISNEQYLVHGFGTSTLENEALNNRFKKTLVLQDIESKILFRWYDPRVMIYLDNIFTEHQMNYLLNSFTGWQFTHPTGYFSWGNEKGKKRISRPITKINEKNSLALDLIAPSNIVYKGLLDFEEVNIDKIKPHEILKNIYQAYDFFEIKQYTDIISYGLYSIVLGEKFMWHPYVKEILEMHWKTQPEDYDFTDAMNHIPKEDWLLIKQDLEEYEQGI